MRRFRALACVTGLLLGAGRLEAQDLSFRLSAAHEIARSRVGPARARLAGTLLGGEVLAERQRFFARLRYGQGRITSKTATRDIVEGGALVGYSVWPWLDVGLGPHARTFVVPGLSDRRWLFWSAHAAARGSPFPGRVESFVELWYGLTGRLSRPAATAKGSGGEAGLEVRLSRPWRARLAYRFEQGRVDGGPRETVEVFALTVGYFIR